jgi:hypothetical protein
MSPCGWHEPRPCPSFGDPESFPGDEEGKPTAPAFNVYDAHRVRDTYDRVPCRKRANPSSTGWSPPLTSPPPVPRSGLIVGVLAGAGIVVSLMQTLVVPLI